MDFGARVKSLLKLKGMTIKELAQALSISESSLYKKLDGRVPVSVSEACRIAEILNVSLDELCGTAFTRANYVDKALNELKEALRRYLEEK
jgi:transcriptional regulator with XRE-family HTH domain